MKNRTTNMTTGPIKNKRTTKGNIPLKSLKDMRKSDPTNLERHVISSDPFQAFSDATDSPVEDALEFLDPSGASSWDDVSRSYKKSGLSLETGLQALAAVPITGRASKAVLNNPKFLKWTGYNIPLYKSSLISLRKASEKVLSYTPRALKARDIEVYKPKKAVIKPEVVVHPNKKQLDDYNRKKKVTDLFRGGRMEAEKINNMPVNRTIKNKKINK